MKYLYYPGCSCSGKTSGRAYSESLIAVFRALNVHYEELTDWNCCGATMYMSVDEQQAFAMSARNLALSESQGDGNGAPVTLVPPCAACYAVLNKTKAYMQEYPQVGDTIHHALDTAGLSYSGNVTVRHPLDVMVNDVGVESIAEQVRKPLKGLRVACYYGCLLVRPYPLFDDPYDPTTMDDLMRSLGAEPVEWPLKTKCCGGSLSGTIEEVGIRLGYILLTEARKRGADVVATACPFCQFNLECFQKQMDRKYKLGARIPIAFFTQLVGMALGLSTRELGLHRLSIPLPNPEKLGEQKEYAHA
ncbi:MAG: CoB--CoM heterodisulfide reductase iron-sulfur subunit B family protein [Fidelibacterota bacterium]|nr:MAG: CoB--CoM heterodisulfide reductase iron-sulfur subunit B family protein [Candidatus Neomarinimicrobiota bacterium]